MSAGADLAVGSRALRDPSVTRQVRAHRKLSGHVFNFLVRRARGRLVADTQCGFKLFRGAVAAELFREIPTDGFGFDVELLLLAQRRGYRIGGGAGQLGRPAGLQGQRAASEGPRMLYEVLAARLRLGRRPPRRARMIARRAREIEPFLAVEVFQRAQALERQGTDVIHLEFGEPDFDTPGR